MLGHHRTYDHSDTPVGGMPPAVVDPAQESLSQALRAGFNVLRLIIVVLLVAYFLSGWFQVNPGEQGVIVRFGELRENADNPDNQYVFREGWHASLPDPFDEKIRLSGQNFKLRIDSFCSVLEPKELAKELSDINLSDVVPIRDKLKPGVDGTMLTGDRNLSHGLFAIEYRIEDAARFVQNVGESHTQFETLLRRLAENAIVRTVAGMPVERVIRTQTDEVTGDFTLGVKRRLSAELERLGTGVTVINIEAKTIEPRRVREAFLAVSDAKSERKEREDEAQQEAHRVLSRTAGSKTKYDALLKAIETYGAAQATGAGEARLDELRQTIDKQLAQAEGEVATRLRQAQSRANEVRERVQQEYKLFVDYLEMYRKYPQLTLVRRWVRMRDAVLSSEENEIFFVPEAGEIEILVNRDPFKLIEADLRRYQERITPGSRPEAARGRRGRP
jgi:regulator of protease activity HflC (stomatin/prohibitin superfamily)